MLKKQQFSNFDIQSIQKENGENEMFCWMDFANEFFPFAI